MTLRFSANLSMLYCELDFLDRFAAAARAGFGAVEYIAPYAYPPDKIAQLLRDFSLQQALFNMPAGNWDVGERGIAGLPGREADFLESVDITIEYAIALDCPQVHCMAGIVPKGMKLARYEQALVDNLKFAATRLGAKGIKLLIEPINPVDMPGYGLTTIEQAEAIMAAVASDNLYLQYDVYHRAVQGSEVTDTFARLQHRIAHVQIADAPGRHEPGTGEIDFLQLFSTLERLGYDGWVGAEYRPAAGTSAGLGWLHALT